MDNILALPEELSEQIFSFFSPLELARCAVVCKLFERFTCSQDLWKRFCINQWDITTYEGWDNINSFKDFYTFLYNSIAAVGIWREHNEDPDGGVVVVSLQKGYIEGKALEVQNGDPIFTPIFRISPEAIPSSIKVLLFPGDDDSISESEWEEGEIEHDGTFMQVRGCWGLTLKRVPLYSSEKHGAASLQGLWMAEYGGHGWEVMSVSLHNNILRALKVVGDPNVPAGELTWEANVTEMKTIDITDPSILSKTSLQYLGRGRISPHGFTNPQWVAGNLTVISQEEITFFWSLLSSTNTYTAINLSHLNIPRKCIYSY